ncbi:MAG: (d)CMP kinase [Treponema sp.]|jgi:cytidylate kinase|nr:(d)CMP kinase [Treponema sp.]
MVIAIDGPAGSGKSTVASVLAERLGLTYVNSGTIYRAFTLLILRNAVDITDEQAVCAVIESAALHYKGTQVYVQGEPLNESLHTDEIDKNISVIAAIPLIRRRVNRLIQDIAEETDIIVEGRDMTTVVFPHSDYRFFLDASLEARAKRRFEQGVSQLSLQDIQETLAARDALDRHEAEGRLTIGHGVTVIDSSQLTIEEVCEQISRRIPLTQH